MGSVRIDGEDESQPRKTHSKKYKLPKKLLNECDAVKHYSVPKKLRCETKNRGRESTIPPLPISRKQHRVSTDRVETLRKNGAKKSRVNMKQGHITKDEEEVAETLYALANMFSDIDNTNKLVLDGEPSQTRSSSVVEPVSSITAAEDAGIVKVQEDSGKPNMIRRCESIVSREQVSNFGVQYDKHRHFNVAKCKGVFSDWLDNTNSATQPSADENIVTANKSKKPRNRCCTHVHLARLIKTMEKSERKLRLMQRPTHSFSEQFSWSKNDYSAAASQQKWNAQLQDRYSPHSASFYNASALFPHLHSALGSKYCQPFSTSQQFMPVDSSFRHNHRLNPVFGQNGPTLYYDNMTHMQLLCNQHL